MEILKLNNNLRGGRLITTILCTLVRCEHGTIITDTRVKEIYMCKWDLLLPLLKYILNNLASANFKDD